MAAQGPKGIERIIKATFYSFKGIMFAFKSEAAFRQELALVIILMPLGLWLGDGGLEKALLAGTLLILLIVELLNTGIEVVVDRFGGEHHKLSGHAKDVGSAAVFFSLVNVAVVWVLVLFF
jgi:diacylglycerol kinase (ATP)